jgi:hypothetical protein
MKAPTVILDDKIHNTEIGDVVKNVARGGTVGDRYINDATSSNRRVGGRNLIDCQSNSAALRNSYVFQRRIIRRKQHARAVARGKRGLIAIEGQPAHGGIGAGNSQLRDVARYGLRLNRGIAIPGKISRCDGV